MIITTLRDQGVDLYGLESDFADVILAVFAMKGWDLIPPRAAARKKFTSDQIEVGKTYRRLNGRVVRVIQKIGEGAWGYVRFENVNRTGRIPPAGKQSAHYFAQDIVEEISIAKRGVTDCE